MTRVDIYPPYTFAEERALEAMIDEQRGTPVIDERPDNEPETPEEDEDNDNADD